MRAVCAAWLTVAPCMVQAQTAVGKWRSCLDYSDVAHVAYAGDRVYAGAKGGVFCYDIANGTLTPMSKGDGLSDVGIAALAYDDATQSLVVAYNNSNVDIVSEGFTYNLSDIKRSEISGDKNIYHIRFANGNAYLATGFGVVVLDLQRMEIKETWYLGAGGGYTPVRDLAFTADSLYAATGEGLKRLSVAERHPAISDRWSADHRLDSLTVGHLCVVGSHLLAAGYGANPNMSRLFDLAPAGATLVASGKISSLQYGNGQLAVCRDGLVYVYDQELHYLGVHDSFSWSNIEANDAVFGVGGTLWVGHTWAGLLALYADGSDATFCPEGPSSGDNCYRLKPFNYRMMLCPGGHTSTYSSSYLAPNLITATGRHWANLDRSNGMLGGMSDVVDAAVNPSDTNEIVAALWGYGVASIRNNSVQTFYDADNTGGALHHGQLFAPQHRRAGFRPSGQPLGARLAQHQRPRLPSARRHLEELFHAPPGHQPRGGQAGVGQHQQLPLVPRPQQRHLCPRRQRTHGACEPQSRQQAGDYDGHRLGAGPERQLVEPAQLR